MIRDYRPTDKAQVLELIDRNTPAYFVPEEKADLAHYLSHEIDAYFVYESEGKILAAGGINRGFDNGHTARISWDLVDPSVHGQGIGTALTHFRIQRMRTYPEIRKIVVRTTQLVYAFYQKQGFQLTETRKDFWAPGLDLYLLEMPL
jgi:ribosomal protein S18 acetylase RimI-like enzyme